MAYWQPDIDLHRLLAALGQEIVASPDEDVLGLCGQVGAPLSGIAHDIRARIAALSDGEAEPKPAPADIVARRELSVRSH